MNQIKKKYIAPNAIDGSKILLSNAEALRAKKADGSSSEILKVNSSDELV